MILACRSDPRIRSIATDIATGFGISGPSDAVRAVEWFVRDKFVFIDEPDELLIDPVVMVNELLENNRIRGDCDDSSMFAACLIYNIGIPVRFKAIQKAPDGSFQHVFIEYFERGFERWIPVDPTIKGIPVYASNDYIMELV